MNLGVQVGGWIHWNKLYISRGHARQLYIMHGRNGIVQVLYVVDGLIGGKPEAKREKGEREKLLSLLGKEY